MTDDFLPRFMGSLSRAKMLRVFFLDQTGVFTAPLAAKRAGVPLRTALKEIKMLEKWGMLKQGKFSITLANGTERMIGGKQKEQAWAINPSFQHSAALSKFVHEVSPINYRQVIKGLKGSGRFVAVILSGSFGRLWTTRISFFSIKPSFCKENWVSTRALATPFTKSRGCYH